MPRGEGNMPWVDAIVKVLGEAKEPMHYTDITQAIIDRQLRKAVGATPPYTVNANITWSIKHEPDTTPFARVGRGLYTLRVPVQNGIKVTIQPTPPAIIDDNEEDGVGVIRALGMFWRRDLVEWRGTPELLGRQQGGDMVDFYNQRGVYLLHDVQRVVYVGQAASQPIGQRLMQHTADRLNGRWDRFSWFGLRAVTDDGKLLDADLARLDVSTLITTLEAVLIEALEPPQNRKRGADLTEVEYLQVENPKRKNRDARAQLLDMVSRLQ